MTENSLNLSPIVCVLGPTGTGKSKLALYLAYQFNGEIINFDSRQFYKNFPCITDQPSNEYKRQCPHWLYGIFEINEKLDAGKFKELAEHAIEKVLAKDHLPILVGGTGLYLQALLYGLAPIPNIPDSIRRQILKKFKEKGIDYLYSWLKDVDPKAADNIHKKDRQRITRALEVYKFTGKPISWWQEQYKKKQPQYNALKIGLWKDLNELISDLSIRIDRMLEQEALQEVRQVWQHYPNENVPGWTAIGCTEILQYLRGHCTLVEAKEQWLQKTRAYAKRQLTWFKKEENIIWFRPEEKEKIKNKIEKWLRDIK